MDNSLEPPVGIRKKRILRPYGSAFVQQMPKQIFQLLLLSQSHFLFNDIYINKGMSLNYS